MARYTREKSDGTWDSAKPERYGKPSSLAVRCITPFRPGILLRRMCILECMGESSNPRSLRSMSWIDQ